MFLILNEDGSFNLIHDNGQGFTGKDVNRMLDDFEKSKTKQFANSIAYLTQSHGFKDFGAPTLVKRTKKITNGIT